ncbi:MAG: NAD(P)-dependent dehydrogenase (short-subunit alcohol dehydrogenase family) [Myxococcota bacterium]|jgi:NAD(P)-dependent dehydrogenase (short-subunit alcohol dehydrogenase family)
MTDMALGDIGKVAVVVGVGASQGLGAAIARRTASEGLHTFIAGRTQSRLDLVAKEIESAGGKVTAVATDTTVASDVVRLLDRAVDEGGSLDFVGFNAGNNRMKPLLEMDDAFFEDTWRLCCMGGFLVGRESARRMVGQGSGSILFTGATASMRARPPFTAFASAKAALRGLSQGMAREFGPQGIHVGHVVIDGVIDGEIIQTRFPQAKKSLGEMGMLNVDAIASAFWSMHTQHPTAWSWELDVRPFKEKW